MGPQPFGCGRALKPLPRTLLGGFNGAATFRLRKARPGRRPPIRGTAASMGPQPFGCGRDEYVWHKVNWAPGFNGAATFRLRKGVGGRGLQRRPCSLQWGRNLSVAEGPCILEPYQGRWRFNGAATFRLRKADPSGGLIRHTSASMGPQPFGCGRIMLDSTSSWTSRMLQWGRNLSVAEGA